MSTCGFLAFTDESALKDLKDLGSSTPTANPLHSQPRLSRTIESAPSLPLEVQSDKPAGFLAFLDPDECADFRHTSPPFVLQLQVHRGTFSVNGAVSDKVTKTAFSCQVVLHHLNERSQYESQSARTMALKRQTAEWAEEFEFKDTYIGDKLEILCFRKKGKDSVCVGRGEQFLDEAQLGVRQSVRATGVVEKKKWAVDVEMTFSRKELTKSAVHSKVSLASIGGLSDSLRNVLDVDQFRAPSTFSSPPSQRLEARREGQKVVLQRGRSKSLERIGSVGRIAKPSGNVGFTDRPDEELCGGGADERSREDDTMGRLRRGKTSTGAEFAELAALAEEPDPVDEDDSMFVPNSSSHDLKRSRPRSTSKGELAAARHANVRNSVCAKKERPAGLGGMPSRKEILGVSVADLMLLQRGSNPRLGVPRFFENALARFYELKGTMTPGVLRIPGNAQNMKEFLEHGRRLDFALVQDIHDVSELIRLWLRELPEPLLTFDFFSSFLSSDCLDTPLPTVKKLAQFIKKRLSPPHQQVLVRLLRMGSDIAANEKVTKMSFSNVAVVLGPNLVWEDASMPMSSLTALRKQLERTNAVVTLMLEHYAEINAKVSDE